MPKFLESLVKMVHDNVERFDNRSFLEAAMATCAIVANSDGSISFSERMKLDQIISVVDQLKIYDPHEAVGLFDKYVTRLQDGGKEAELLLLEKIRKGAAGKTERLALLKMAWAICRADGNIRNSERDQIERLASHLGIDAETVYKQF